jgi:hypothetical protein
VAAQQKSPAKTTGPQGHVEAVQGRRDQGVETYEIDQLIGSMLAEGLDREAKRLGQGAAPHQRIRKIEGNAFLLRMAARSIGSIGSLKRERTIRR